MGYLDKPAGQLGPAGNEIRVEKLWNDLRPEEVDPVVEGPKIRSPGVSFIKLYSFVTDDEAQ